MFIDLVVLAEHASLTYPTVMVLTRSSALKVSSMLLLFVVDMELAQ